MKNLLVLTASIFIFASTSAQETDDDKKAAYKAARETLKNVESTLLKEKKDPKAIELITTAKNASNKSYEYLTSLPGYQPAVLETVNNKSALRDFKNKVKTEDETYIALAAEARTAQKAKRDYLISISPEYKKAWEDYNAYRSVKK
ncbi:MAG: hypothetical protein O6939_01635 [Bacteroidetes bacterium]|nr:hypothetical protein [Bacteroidota bacterium]